MSVFVSLGLLVLAVAVGGSAPEGPTLFPPPSPTDVVEFVVAGAIVALPRADADVLRRASPGDTVTVAALRQNEEGRWVEVAGGGFVRASWLDGPSAPFEGDPVPGTEGLAGGRVLSDAWRPADLVVLPDSLAYPGYENRVMRLRRDAARAFVRLAEAARADGVDLRVISAWRDASAQRRLYARALARDPDQRWSAAPGRSEHRLGTTLDVGPPDLAPLDPALERHAAGRWLREHGAEFGFVLSFSRERHEQRGVIFEPWHLRWVAEAVADDGGW
ncbi:MAG: M15 family metallopeptidase [bacterium]